MADPATLTSLLSYLSAAAGLGTAAMGVVDATKVFGGGPSNFGFGSIKKGLAPFLKYSSDAPPAFGRNQILASLKSNWINGVPKAEQKAKAKSLIHLNISQGNATSLASASGVDGALLESLAKKIAAGEKATQEEINVLGQFDAVLSAVLDDVYERGDQQYRNGAKAMAMLVSTVMGVVGGGLAHAGEGYWGSADFGVALLIGISATPLAPIAKDLSTSLQAAVAAARSVRR